jgi:peptide chain release factor 1
LLSGTGVKKFFKNEIGSHRWVRVPPTEKRGRTQTSTITVSLSGDNEYKDVELNYNDIKIETTRGRGAGGQHRNVTDSCIVMTHFPTGIKVVSNGRSQHDNKDQAYTELKRRVNDCYRNRYVEKTSQIKKEQIGGSRSDRRRSYRVKDGIVVDHITNKSASIKDIMKGKINLLK